MNSAYGNYKFMEHIALSEANSCSSGSEIPRRLQNPKVYMYFHMKLEFLTAVIMKMTLFRDVTPRTLRWELL
jgi:hypothetical protein